MQSHLVVLSEGGKPPASSTHEPDLPSFLASISSAWREGEVRPTHSAEVKPRYLRGIRIRFNEPRSLQVRSLHRLNRRLC